MPRSCVYNSEQSPRNSCRPGMQMSRPCVAAEEPRLLICKMGIITPLLIKHPRWAKPRAKHYLPMISPILQIGKLRVSDSTKAHRWQGMETRRELGPQGGQRWSLWQAAPKDPSLLVHTHWRSPSHPPCARVGLCDQQNIAEMMVYHFQD